MSQEEEALKALWQKTKICHNELEKKIAKSYIDFLRQVAIYYLEFLGYFMIRKVIGSKELMKTVVRVMRRFAKWMREKDYINEEKYEMLDGTICWTGQSMTSRMIYRRWWSFPI